MRSPVLMLMFPLTWQEGESLAQTASDAVKPLSPANPTAAAIPAIGSIFIGQHPGSHSIDPDTCGCAYHAATA